uniref:DUF4408 domain-containing protein n=1 Tax=Panagrellus redivivus TaxID=6233 RepID=A0A7E4V4B3_PANRE
MADVTNDSITAVRSLFVPFVFCTVNLILVILVTCTKKKLPPTAVATATPVLTEPTNIVEPAPDTSTATTVDQSQAQTTFVAPEITQPQEASDSAASSRPAAPLVDSARTTRSRLQRTKSPPRGKINSTARQTYTKDLDVERCLPEDSALIDRPFSKDRLTAESVTEEIRVPIGKTATSPVPQSSLTHRKNLKDIGNPRPDPSSVKFGEERISTTRSQPAAND